MPRLRRLCPPGITQHIIQRGNNRQICFASFQDFSFYINCLHEFALTHCVDIHAWVFMTNHVHLLATPHLENSISRLMQDLGRKYVLYYNRQHGRTGTLWEGRYKSCLVASDNYLLSCYRYIELNPVRAKMVKDPAKYSWSSYQCNALGKKSKLITYHKRYLSLGTTTDQRQNNYKNLFRSSVNQELLAEIRQSTNKNMALGSEKFKLEVEAQYQRRLHQNPVGRPVKKLQ